MIESASKFDGCLVMPSSNGKWSFLTMQMVTWKWIICKNQAVDEQRALLSGEMAVRLVTNRKREHVSSERNETKKQKNKRKKNSV